MDRIFAGSKKDGTTLVKKVCMLWTRAPFCTADLSRREGKGRSLISPLWLPTSVLILLLKSSPDEFLIIFLSRWYSINSLSSGNAYSMSRWHLRIHTRMMMSNMRNWRKLFVQVVVEQLTSNPWNNLFYMCYIGVLLEGETRESPSLLKHMVEFLWKGDGNEESILIQSEMDYVRKTSGGITWDTRISFCFWPICERHCLMLNFMDCLVWCSSDLIFRAISY